MERPGSRRRRSSTLQQIDKLKRDREARRKNMAEYKRERAEEDRRNAAAGRPGDVDFQRMIDGYRAEQLGSTLPHGDSGALKICVCARKRPVNPAEVRRRDYDSVTCVNPRAVVHDCKLRVDGISKYLDNTEFEFDHTFDERTETAEVYEHSARSLVRFLFEGGRGTCFAYGQTGSGKTYTMAGVQRLAAADIFELLDGEYRDAELLPFVSFFEIYGGQCQDLLNERRRLAVREDGFGEVQIAGLEEVPVETVTDLLAQIERGNGLRTTHATERNDASSRSHAICCIVLRDAASMRLHGKLSLIDLAGSERDADSRNHDRKRRMESAEINKSLLALKECIRALDADSGHVPYRGSKLTLVLKDSFTLSSARTTIIATVSPTASVADHTLNTLRYADRVKQTRVGTAAARAAPPPARVVPPPPAAAGGFGAPAAAPDGAGKALSPTARRLAEANAAARSGQITADEKRKLKEGIIQSSVASDALLPTVRVELGDLSELSLPGPAGAGAGAGAGAETEPETEPEPEPAGAGDPEPAPSLYDDEEELLNAHMAAIQSNAELLTEEGRLLAAVQDEAVDDAHVDAYAARLADILEEKAALIMRLQAQLQTFRGHLEASG